MGVNPGAAGTRAENVGARQGDWLGRMAVVCGGKGYGSRESTDGPVIARQGSVCKCRRTRGDVTGQPPWAMDLATAARDGQGAQYVQILTSQPVPRASCTAPSLVVMPST